MATLPLNAVAAEPAPPKAGATTRLLSGAGRTVVAAWKFLVAAALTQTLPGSILIVGWTFRLSQRVVLKQWWKQSHLAAEGFTFEEFASAGSAERQHQHWPNWVLEQNRAWVRAPFAPGWSRIRATFRALFHSLWLNLKVGVQAMFNTWVFTLPGSVLMVFAWYAGWHNSFNKGYEQAVVGPLLGVSGILLFIGAMYYVPMAQMRQASTGDWRSFYQFHTIWQLIRKRWLACLGLAVLYTIFSVPITVLKTVPGFFPQMNPALVELPPAEALAFANRYYFYAGFLVFAAFVVLRIVAARIYASALLGSVRSGALPEDALGEKEWEALHRLDLLALKPRAPRHFLVRTITWFGTKLGRATLGVALFLAWFSFLAQVYTSEFLNRSEYSRGWLNQPLVQLPWFNYIPDALEEEAARDRPVKSQDEAEPVFAPGTGG